MGDPLTPAEAAYIAAFEAYLKAPRERRDQQLIRALCDLALDELLRQRNEDDTGQKRS